MSLDNIIQRILDDAETRAAAIAKEARAKADEIAAAAAESAGTLKKKIIEDAENVSRDEAKRASVMKNLEARKEVARKKIALIDRAFDDAYRALIGLDDARTVKVVEDGLGRIGENDGTLLFSRNDAHRLNERFVGHYNKARGTRFEFGGYLDPEDGGFILERGRVRIDMKFSTLVKGLRETMLFEVSEELFG